MRIKILGTGRKKLVHIVVPRKRISKLQFKIIAGFLPVTPSRRHIDLTGDSNAGAIAWRHGAHFRLVHVCMSNFRSHDIQ